MPNGRQAGPATHVWWVSAVRAQAGEPPAQDGRMRRRDPAVDG